LAKAVPSIVLAPVISNQKRGKEKLKKEKRTKKKEIKKNDGIVCHINPFFASFLLFFFFPIFFLFWDWKSGQFV